MGDAAPEIDREADSVTVDDVVAVRLTERAGDEVCDAEASWDTVPLALALPVGEGTVWDRVSRRVALALWLGDAETEAVAVREAVVVWVWERVWDGGETEEVRVGARVALGVNEGEGVYVAGLVAWSVSLGDNVGGDREAVGLSEGDGVSDAVRSGVSLGPDGVALPDGVGPKVWLALSEAVGDTVAEVVRVRVRVGAESDGVD